MISLVLFAAFVGVAAGDGKVFNESCGYAPLCGDAPRYMSPPEPGIPRQLFLDFCCPLADTQPVQPDGCDIVNPEGDSYRVVGTNAPICGENNVNCEGQCDADDELVVTVQFVENTRSVCCETCSCFGDPNCISFDGTADLWILCDAREPVPGNPDERCVIRRSICQNQKDHENNQCQWIGPNKGSASAQRTAEDAWSVARFGSPCIPNPASGPSKFLMYSADTFAITIGQNERGIIESVDLSLECGNFSMKALDCFNSIQPWTIKSEKNELPSFFKRTTFPNSHEILWNLLDPDTGIQASIRCTANLVNGQLTVKRLNIEDVAEPNPDFKEDRENLGGFCVTGSLPKTGTHEHTDNIVEQGLCRENHRNDNQMRLRIGRVICNNPNYQQLGVRSCFEHFCSRFFLPYYTSVEECLNEIDPPIMDIQSTAEAFCRAVAGFELDMCIALINEQGSDDILDGFEQAYIRYVEGYSPDPEQCVPANEINRLPSSLLNCQEGVELQYEESPGNWVTFVAFPQTLPLCSGKVIFNCANSPELFQHPIRIKQKQSFADCNINLCYATDGVTTFLEYNVPPTPPPTPFPSETIPPTDADTGAPTPGVETPHPTTSQPTPKPSAEPTTSEPTPEPTTSEPTSEPTTSEPTGEPTLSPTPFPTCPPVEDSEGLLINFENAEITQNNLGTPFGKIVIKSVGTYIGTPISLHISQTSIEHDYEQPEGTTNGLQGGYLVIWLNCDSKLELKFSLKDNNGNPVSVALLDLSFVQLLSTNGERALSVRVCGSEDVYLDDDTSLATSTSGGCDVFTSTIDSTSSDLPNPPTKLTPEQLKSAVTTRHEDANSVIVDLSVNGPECENGRRFLIAGTSNLADCFTGFDKPTYWPTPPHTWAPEH